MNYYNKLRGEEEEEEEVKMGRYMLPFSFSTASSFSLSSAELTVNPLCLCSWMFNWCFAAATVATFPFTCELPKHGIDAALFVHGGKQ